jgi:hypothetical protein
MYIPLCVLKLKKLPYATSFITVNHLATDSLVFLLASRPLPLPSFLVSVTVLCLLQRIHEYQFFNKSSTSERHKLGGVCHVW